MAADVDELDIVSAIWILASNDETSIITYEGVVYRLGLPPHFDVKALIHRRAELFRRGANPAQLEEWKQDMREGRRIPSWIRALADERARTDAIQALSVDAVFRSQFRASRKAERSPIEIIKWGLEHVDRLRKARSEARDASAKSWQMWLVLAVGVAGLVTQVLIAWLKKGG